MIELKETKLAGEKPKCQLERVKLDLSKDLVRREFLTKMNGECRKALILTEGVVPYLSVEQVGTLADDLHCQTNFRFWIVDYFSPRVIQYFKNKSPRDR